MLHYLLQFLLRHCITKIFQYSDDHKEWRGSFFAMKLPLAKTNPMKAWMSSNVKYNSWSFAALACATVCLWSLRNIDSSKTGIFRLQRWTVLRKVMGENLYYYSSHRYFINAMPWIRFTYNLYKIWISCLFLFSRYPRSTRTICRNLESSLFVWSQLLVQEKYDEELEIVMLLSSRYAANKAP